jgi:hypothetical protein
LHNVVDVEDYEWWDQINLRYGAPIAQERLFLFSLLCLRISTENNAFGVSQHNMKAMGRWSAQRSGLCHSVGYTSTTQSLMQLPKGTVMLLRAFSLVQYLRDQHSPRGNRKNSRRDRISVSMPWLQSTLWVRARYLQSITVSSLYRLSVIIQRDRSSFLKKITVLSHTSFVSMQRP